MLTALSPSLSTPQYRYVDSLLRIDSKTITVALFYGHFVPVSNAYRPVSEPVHPAVQVGSLSN